MPPAHLAASGWRLIISLGGVQVAHSDLRPTYASTVPPEPVATDIGPIASGGSVSLDAVDVIIARIDDDRAGRFLSVVANRPAIVFRIDLADVDGGDREFLIWQRPIELRRLGDAHAVLCHATGAEQKRSAVEKPRPRPKHGCPVP